MPKKKEVKAVAAESASKSAEKPVVVAKKESRKNSSIPGWVAAGILFIAVVGLFVYAQNSISKASEEKKAIEGQTRVLKNTINTLEQKVSDLNVKTQDLEESARKSNEYLFAESISKRKLPDSVETKDWQLYKDEEWKMELVYPKTWQMSQTADPESSKPAEGAAKAEAMREMVFEPIGQSSFIRSLQIIPYNFGQEMSLEDKVKSFEGKDVLDKQDFEGGKLVYFIEQANDIVIPTVMILSDNGDYKAVYRVNDLFNAKYFDFLTDFEAMIGKIKVSPKVEVPTP
ncbi:MAG TPA: hypothetical protein VMX18_04185 [Candidatus Bipolaricaulota bacterium]|nr:hypothetical protein [Candidatus Bipolaricaulota bacterium]